ncbi:lichenicidin A2 family type 2 lantibiotic [Peribacillus simplex]
MFRETFVKESPVGQSLKQISLDEMNVIYGGTGSDVDVRSSLVCTALASFIGSYLGSAAFKCGKDNKK